MVYNCILCDVYQAFRDEERSFHQIPSSPEIRRLWLKAIGKDDASKWARICSDHFKKDDFVEACREDGVIRRKLKRGTAIIPSVNLRNTSELNNHSDSSNEVRGVPVNNDIEARREEGLPDAISLCIPPDTTIEGVINPISMVISSPDSSNAPEIQQVKIADQPRYESEADEWEDFEEYIGTVTPLASRKRKSDVTIEQISPGLKKACSTQIPAALKNQNVEYRLRVGGKYHYISRDDFTSDEKWSIVLQFIKQKSKLVHNATRSQNR
ncbi:hypothetical protein QAD02_017813 [Eretmocerus hayati]|uniref:Uncharacterized protein n=1 Tax=Eretmocerus hayati TaxID=131215 RepID=A0ACC2PG73_9HYME|nr:hypothetical protein QAD02_017813 [Eretmocerus hayati]